VRANDDAIFLRPSAPDQVHFIDLIGNLGGASTGARLVTTRVLT
jgi:hypothetical protein